MGAIILAGRGRSVDIFLSRESVTLIWGLLRYEVC